MTLFEIKEEWPEEPKNNDKRILSILGEQYAQSHYDWYIMDAIKLASRWDTVEITVNRIFYLRNWIRENMQHGHNIDYSEISTMHECRAFIDQVIEAEYKYAEGEIKASEEDHYSENRKLFSNKNNTGPTIIEICDDIKNYELTGPTHFVDLSKFMQII